MPRAEFSKKTKREAYERSGGFCEAVGILYGLEKRKRCNLPLSFGVEYDHAVRAADGGDNSLGNCRAVCKKCHAWKTQRFDVPQAAKTKRMNDKFRGIKNKTTPVPKRAKPSKPKRDKLPDMNGKKALYVSE